jgi:hypothetical protein
MTRMMMMIKSIITIMVMTKFIHSLQSARYMQMLLIYIRVGFMHTFIILRIVHINALAS